MRYNIKDKVKQQISDGKLRAAIDSLLAIKSHKPIINDFLDDIRVHAGSLSSLEREYNAGLLSRDNYSVGKQRIVSKLFRLMAQPDLSNELIKISGDQDKVKSGISTKGFCPIFVLVDSSISMHLYMDQVEVGLKLLLENKKYLNPNSNYAFSIISFSNEVHTLLPLMDIKNAHIPSIDTQGITNLSNAFDYLSQQISTKKRSGLMGNEAPAILLITDGFSSENWKKGHARLVREIPEFSIHSIAISDHKLPFLEQIGTIYYATNFCGNDILFGTNEFKYLKSVPKPSTTKSNKSNPEISRTTNNKAVASSKPVNDPKSTNSKKQKQPFQFPSVPRIVWYFIYSVLYSSLFAATFDSPAGASKDGILPLFFGWSILLTLALVYVLMHKKRLGSVIRWTFLFWFLTMPICFIVMIALGVSSGFEIDKIDPNFSMAVFYVLLIIIKIILIEIALLISPNREKKPWNPK